MKVTRTDLHRCYSPISFTVIRSSTGGSGGWEPDEDGEIRNTYRSIKDAPQYPRGVRNVQNGTTRNVVKDQQLLKQLRKVDSGK